MHFSNNAFFELTGLSYCRIGGIREIIQNIIDRRLETTDHIDSDTVISEAWAQSSALQSLSDEPTPEVVSQLRLMVSVYKFKLKKKRKSEAVAVEDDSELPAVDASAAISKRSKLDNAGIFLLFPRLE